MNSCCVVVGVRKQETKAPLIRFGGYPGGTATTMSCFPARDSISHAVSALTDAEVVMLRPS